MKARCASVRECQIGEGEWVGWQAGEGGWDRGFLERKPGKGITFEMYIKKYLISKSILK